MTPETPVNTVITNCFPLFADNRRFSPIISAAFKTPKNSVYSPPVANDTTVMKDGDMEATEDLLTQQQLCNRIKISKPTLRKMHNEGLPRIPVGKRQFRYSYRDVLNWLKSRTTSNPETNGGVTQQEL